MSRRSLYLTIYAILALSAAIVFFFISTDHRIYAPGAYTLHHAIADRGLGDIHDEIRQSEGGLPFGRHAFSTYVILRKFYSIVAFTVVGLFSAPLLARRVRIRADAAIVAGFSAIIEVGQKFSIAPYESLAWETFDVACGAVGGVLGALLWNALSDLRSRRDGAVPSGRAAVRSGRSGSD